MSWKKIIILLAILAVLAAGILLVNRQEKLKQAVEGRLLDLAEPRPTGSAAGVLPALDAMLPIYYELRGWTADGAPSQERLAALELA